MTDTIAPGPAATPDGRRISPWTILLAVIIALLVAMWVYAFGFAPKKAAYRIDDAAWRARAQEICERYGAERLELVDTSEGYIAEPTEAQMIERADIVDRATDILELQLRDVLAVRPASERDQNLLAEYEGYWRTLLDDRRAYTERLRDLQLEPYYETMADGGPVSNVLTDFAVVNEMRACVPPGELGGDT